MRENEREGLLLDCRVGLRENETTEVESIGSTHGNLLSELWYESDDDVKRKAASDTAGCTLTSGMRTWHDRSCIRHGFPC